VVYVGHVPHGFYEEEMRGFFGQFGEVRRLRLARSRKTGRSKGYAFVEFESAEVARIVAGAMDGYLMFGRRLAVQVVGPGELHAETFKNANRKFRVVPWGALEKKRREKEKTPDKVARLVEKRKRIWARRMKRIESLGIDYEL